MGKFALCLLLSLASVACQNTIVYEVPHEANLAPVVGIEPEVGAFALSAMVLWKEATGGAFAPDAHIGCDGTEDLCVHVVDGLVDDCADVDGLRGCMRMQSGTMDLGTATPIDQQVNTIAHEIGHFLGLGHADSGLMMSNRPKDERRMPCIDEGTLAAFSAAHPDADTFIACYTDSTRAAALEWLAAIE